LLLLRRLFVVVIFGQRTMIPAYVNFIVSIIDSERTDNYVSVNLEANPGRNENTLAWIGVMSRCHDSE
jgi:hypothetical protein